MQHELHACLQGLERTRGSVIRNEFQELRQEGNIDEIRASLDGIYEALMDLDIFDDVDMAIQPSRRVSSHALHRKHRRHTLSAARRLCNFSWWQRRKVHCAGWTKQVRCGGPLQREAPLPCEGRHLHTGE
jgi:hypothetical protein